MLHGYRSGPGRNRLVLYVFYPNYVLNSDDESAAILCSFLPYFDDYIDRLAFTIAEPQ